MGLIKGITVILIEKKKTGEDGFGDPVYEKVEIPVENVLVAPINSDSVITSTNLSGKMTEYVLAIPKDDTHEWKDCSVRFFNKEWNTVGEPIQGIPNLVPLGWNRKVTVRCYG